jgi:hypothetical protein
VEYVRELQRRAGAGPSASVGTPTGAPATPAPDSAATQNAPGAAVAPTGGTR